MEQIDFHKAGIIHLLWKKRVRGFLDGKETITRIEAISYKECELGKWLYSQGLVKYNNLPQMQELEKIHIELHAIVNNTLQFKNQGNIAQSEEEYKKLESLSKKIIILLTALAIKIQY